MELKPAFASSGLIEAGQDQPIDTAPEHLAASPMADLRRWRGGSATALPGKLAKEINRKRRRLQQHGATSSRPATEPAERLKLLEMLLVWKRQWLDQRGLVSLSLSAPATTGMLGALLRDTESGAELMVLSVADKPVAIEFGFSDARHHFSYLASYDAAFEAHGPGSVLMADTMAMLARRGMETYDLMYPLEGYKRQWAHFARPVGACSMAFTLRGRLSQSLGGTAMRGLARGAWRTLPTAIRQPIARRIAG
jgi:CelD/BcsL family acetyltransferase involved in cellulose biosynthesis